MKYTIRGLREGLWYEVVAISDSSDDINELVSDGEGVASFEVDWSEKRKKFVIKKLIFSKKNLSIEEKHEILNIIKDFVESLNS
ncbi:MAG: hypothetical protein ACTSX9_07415 [Candidatus Njordarchaeales archaeon]